MINYSTVAFVWFQMPATSSGVTSTAPVSTHDQEKVQLVFLILFCSWIFEPLRNICVCIYICMHHG
jgi:hypothetical protein